MTFLETTERKGSVMKKINASKLSLHRETLAALSNDVLHDVNGGNVVNHTIRISRLVCPTRRCISAVPVLCAGGGGGGNAGGDAQ